MIQVVDFRGEIITGRKFFMPESGKGIIMPAGFPHSVNAPYKFRMVLTMIRSK